MLKLTGGWSASSSPPGQSDTLLHFWSAEIMLSSPHEQDTWTDSCDTHVGHSPAHQTCPRTGQYRHRSWWSGYSCHCHTAAHLGYSGTLDMTQVYPHHLHNHPDHHISNRMVYTWACGCRGTGCLCSWTHNSSHHWQGWNSQGSHTLCPLCWSAADTVLHTLHSLHTGVGLQYWLFQWMVNDNFHGSVDDSQ